MTLIHAPERGHSCDISWELVPWPVPDRPSLFDAGPPPGITHRYSRVHDDDPPGTVRQCPQCGRYWVAEKRQPGTAYVNWRPERRLERWMRERSARRAALR